MVVKSSIIFLKTYIIFIEGKHCK